MVADSFPKPTTKLLTMKPSRTRKGYGPCEKCALSVKGSNPVELPYPVSHYTQQERSRLFCEQVLDTTTGIAIACACLLTKCEAFSQEWQIRLLRDSGRCPLVRFPERNSSQKIPILSAREVELSLLAREWLSFSQIRE